jgi:hypothetical protein
MTTFEPLPLPARADGISVDVICGGFPCQDISSQERLGIDGERSGLWSEYARIIGELRPRYVIVENVAALLFGGLTEFSETWPRSGTMRNGIAYRLPPLARLTDVIASGLWPTRDTTKATQYSLPREVAREAGIKSGKRGGLNPTWVEWLMGFPLQWTELKDWATPSSRKSRKSSAGQS